LNWLQVLHLLKQGILNWQAVMGGLSSEVIGESWRKWGKENYLIASLVDICVTPGQLNIVRVLLAADAGCCDILTLTRYKTTSNGAASYWSLFQPRNKQARHFSIPSTSIVLRRILFRFVLRRSKTIACLLDPFSQITIRVAWAREENIHHEVKFSGHPWFHKFIVAKKNILSMVCWQSNIISLAG
jgi:hypothetical protein